MSLTKVSYSMINGASVNVLDYGAVGDGTTDCSTALLAAFEACRVLNNTGINVQMVFPQGIYRVTYAKAQSNTDPYTSIAAKSFYHFVQGSGAGQWNAHNPQFSGPNDYGFSMLGQGRVVVLADGDANSWFLSNTGYFSYNIENLTVRSYDETKTTHGLAHLSLVHSTWRNFGIENFQKGVAHYLGNSTNNYFHNYFNIKNQTGLVLGTKNGTDVSSSRTNANHWFGFEISQNGTNLSDNESLSNGCVQFISAENNSFNGGTFQTNLSPILLQDVNGLSFNDCYFEYTCNGRPYDTGYSTTFSINPLLSSLVTGTTNTFVTGVAINSCYISSGGSQYVQIKADATHLVDTVILTNCKISGIAGYSFYTGSANYIKGLREVNTARYDENARITPSTSYPPQYELNPSTQANIATYSNRYLDLAVSNQYNRMSIVPNVRPCAFHATGGTHTSVTGDGTWYTLIAPTAIYDGDVNYSTSTGKFTAPRAGYYTFMGQIWIQNLGSPSTYTEAQISLSKNSAVPAGQYTSVLVNPVGASTGGSLILPYTGGFTLAAGDTVEVQVYVAGGAKTVNVNGNSSFYGQMIG
jgi:hypothetical protein